MRENSRLCIKIVQNVLFRLAEDVSTKLHGLTLQIQKSLHRNEIYANKWKQ